ncbi:LytR/AlgR family response regulator transcription factor [Leeuwenhoekiella sp. MAR_2009_132]|uniref:LytR/AlgR family response regulator transcription factor n=1 Tax=Leeuwenhoekiella sp. MAR_2009_132 TaxID=1392489 RepID=UPI00048E3CD5|nr:LytTR family DNA-binding domain-containing protein [Leeuwenhoekiella sp. MAR_2009_132]
MSIRVYLIDDEPKALSILQNKLERFCPQLTIIGKSQKPEEAITFIKSEKPELIFLDIAMPTMTGFELLREFDEPSFEIIFVTAFDHYAVDAIKHCAIGYIVKPVAKEDLILSVHRAIESIEYKHALSKNKQLIANLGVRTFQQKKIVVPTQNGLQFLKIADILRCEGTDGYTKIYLADQTSILSSHSIGHFADLLGDSVFFKTHKSHLINLDYLKSYLNEGYVILEGKHQVPVSRNKRSDFLNFLRNNAH